VKRSGLDSNNGVPYEHLRRAALAHGAVRERLVPRPCNQRSKDQTISALGERFGAGRANTPIIFPHRVADVSGGSFLVVLL